MQRWVERQFRFDVAEELFPAIVERVRGTPARVEEKIRHTPSSVLGARRGDAWSVQEHIGHLLDLDALHSGRIDDFLAGAAVLRPADMTNRKTYDANHNARPIAALAADFRRERMALVTRFDGWPVERVGQTARHPRLDQPMRVIDMALFTAEHDDHHPAIMTAMLTGGTGR